mmetsp:Transcript_125171/g.362145  ORF Transcript_125171/g.362145 Transcript_125171/m.362145 type:complete len:201 (+) Transcript_125171:2210-2812(+)
MRVCETVRLATSRLPSPSNTRSRTPAGISARCGGIFQNGCTREEFTISSTSPAKSATGAVDDAARTAMAGAADGADGAVSASLASAASAGGALTAAAAEASSTSMSSSPSRLTSTTCPARNAASSSKPGPRANLSAMESHAFAASGRALTKTSFPKSRTDSLTTSSSNDSIMSRNCSKCLRAADRSALLEGSSLPGCASH